MEYVVNSITIIGRRWLDRQNGNTYCTAQIIVNGKTVHKTEKDYGYGDYYVQAATKWLNENGYVQLAKYSNGSEQMLWQYCQRRSIPLENMAFDVLKKEL